MNLKELKREFRKKCKEHKTPSYSFSLLGSIVVILGLIIAVLTRVFFLKGMLASPIHIILFSIGCIFAVVGLILYTIGENMLSKNFKKYLNMHGLTIKKKIPSEETKKENITNIPSIDVNNENQEKIENTKNYDLNSYIEERKQESYVEENNTEKLDINEEENINEVIKDDKIETKESKENDEFKEELERKENIVDDKEEKETKNEEHKDIYEELENTDEELIDEIESNKSELIKPEETSKFTYDKRLKEYKIVKDNIEIITKEEITFDISNYAQALLENYKINSNKIVDYIYNDEEFKSTYKNIKKASISNLLNNPTIKIYNKTLSEISYYNNELDETKIITISIGGVYDKIFYLRIEE